MWTNTWHAAGALPGMVRTGSWDRLAILWHVILPPGCLPHVDSPGGGAIMQTPSIHLTPEKLAERLGTSLRSLERWRVTGDGPKFLRAGVRRILYPLAEVERWEADRLCGSRAAEMARRAKEAA